MADNTQKYDDSQIQVLEGLEAVRKRPGMYIGTTQREGPAPFNLRNCRQLHRRSAGRLLLAHRRHAQGRRLGAGARTTAAACPRASIRRSACRRWRSSSPCCTRAASSAAAATAIAGGLHGVGASVVNALSRRLEATNCRDGHKYTIALRLRQGRRAVQHASARPTRTACRSASGRTTAIFEEHGVRPRRAVKARLREQAFLNAGVKITLRDERGEEQPEYEELLLRGRHQELRRVPQPQEGRRAAARGNHLRQRQQGNEHRGGRHAVQRHL